MPLAVDLNVVGFDLVDDQLDHLRCRSFANAVAVLARMEIKMDSEECFGTFHPWRIGGPHAGGAYKTGGNYADYE